MPRPKKSSIPTKTTAANVGYEAELWRMADALRGSMDAAEYKPSHVLTPGRYVCAEAQEDDGEPFEDKMRRLVAQLEEQQAEAAIVANLEELGFWKRSS